ncbi:MAG TPA: hypothetical protein VJP07_03250 [Dehalococcoidia bacterium]|nr:hypothetical protein [Dehalococcoidia bacterium]
MAACANCGREIPGDPNELEDVEECRYCDEVLCSQECLEEHELSAHPNEGLPPADADEERRV